ncbi:COP9 signalosome complex subunit 6-like protein [Basidiobolus meristosporus CBS 931.73]|uniref:COP9 signalosome complex subunit 6 n=1 Tax=Basidiobolus meristosporus CBS 931.73 TaxID=1314790 RepID=A0A1Y1XN74_9FUNG|nr:COP9 signalosome complex subunit 6-like protein [Basidiobolus meristosporus CBS 931.73]|eukprot:ORX87173.1 COP9 signalosome complex subunit 6-like protein [Basidiobolus meristosporus CBS 931.73]
MTSMDITPQETLPTSGVVSNAENNSGILVSLHPLTLMNISDHFSRIKVQQKCSQPQILGALLGAQSGRDIEIFNSYELAFNVIDGQIEVDGSYFITKQEQFRQVFPEYDFLGWYSVGSQPSSSDLAIHRQLMTYNESPLFLQLDPHDLTAIRNLPITIYETFVDIVDEQAQTLFIQSNYKIETGEAERIAVDHVAHTVNESGESNSALIAHLTNQRNAIKMLHTRVDFLKRYIEDVKSGNIPEDPQILREIASLCNQLPAMNGPEFRDKFMTEYNDVLLISYLATLTKGINSIQGLVEKFNVANSSQSRRRGFFGVF